MSHQPQQQARRKKSIWPWLALAVVVAIGGFAFAGGFSNLGAALSETLSAMDGTASH
jgi:hypothetical protein